MVKNTDTLPEVLRRLREASLKPMNEENTKASRIDPILRALGWDVENPDEVQREFKHKPRDKPVDYALVDGGVRLFLEAKGLGQNLDDHRWSRQIIGYASVAGVRWIVLTDGNEFHIYNASAEVVVEKKLFRKIRISDDSDGAMGTLLLLAKHALKGTTLDELWRSEFIDSQVRAAIEGMLSSDSKFLADYVAKHTRDLSKAEIKASIGRCQVRIEFPGERATVARRQMRARSKGKAMGRRTEPVGRVGQTDAEPPLMPLIRSGVLQPPAALTKTYKGKTLSATVLPTGKIKVGSIEHDTPSAAAVAARAAVSGKRQATNGWDFWLIEKAGVWVQLGSMRGTTGTVV